MIWHWGDIRSDSGKGHQSFRASVRSDVPPADKLGELMAQKHERKPSRPQETATSGSLCARAVETDIQYPVATRVWEDEHEQKRTKGEAQRAPAPVLSLKGRREEGEGGRRDEGVRVCHSC